MASSELTKFLKQQHILDLIDDENFTEVYKLCPSNVQIISELTRFFLDCNIKPDNYMRIIPASYLYKSPEITKYDISDSVTSIGDLAFYDCKSLTSVTIPDSVTSIGEDAFSYCSSLTSITIPDSVTSIGYDAFYNCTSLTSVTIPDSVTSIGYYAFSGCTSLTSVTIGNSVTTIGNSAFYGCSSLTSITYGGTKTQWDAITKGRNWDLATGNYTITYLK